MANQLRPRKRNQAPSRFGGRGAPSRPHQTLCVLTDRANSSSDTTNEQASQYRCPRVRYQRRQTSHTYHWIDVRIVAVGIAEGLARFHLELRLFSEHQPAASRLRK